jgi:putative Holliday junction resolvase
MTHKRAMALDVGTKTCGVAVSDPLGWTAQPHSTIRFAGEHDLGKAFVELQKIIRELDIKTLVIGLPLNMNGSEGPQATKVRSFIKGLRNHLAKHKCDPETLGWVFWDERLSSTGAERSLLQADLSRAKRKEVIDKMAAVFILQGYLQQQENQGI